jgi:peptidoglycan/LPS O-acetylase OafA/YrhL
VTEERLRHAAASIGLRRSSTFIPELESVRGIAVLLVFAFHDS